VKGTALAGGDGPAVVLAHGDEQRVELVEQGGVRGQMCLDAPTRLLVADVVGQKAVTREHPSHVRVGDEQGATCGVEQDGIHRLGAESGDRQHLPAKRKQRRAAHAVETSAEALEQPSGEGLQPSSFEPIGSGGADRFGQLTLPQRHDAIGTEQTARAQRGHPPGRVRPRRVLDQHGAHRHLVRRASRPPMLRPEAPLQSHVEPQQACLRRIRRWPRDLPPSENSWSL
jgi:hypothetical protein